MVMIKNQRVKDASVNPDITLGLNCAVEYLHHAKFFVMPVKKVYDFISKSVPYTKFSFDEYLDVKISN